MELFACPFKKELSPTAQIVPNAGTDISTRDTWAYELFVTNYSASDTTLTLQDKQSVPLTLFTATIVANSTVSFSFPNGLFFSGGITWTAGAATSLSASVTAVRQANNGI